MFKLIKMKKMKLIILLLPLLLISCSSDDDNNGVFSTPSWIQGTWKGNTTNETLTFTKGDIKYNNSYSFGDQSRKSNFLGVQVIANTDSTYIIDYYQEKGTVPIRFTFIKKSIIQMESRGHLPGSFTKQ